MKNLKLVLLIFLAYFTLLTPTKGQQVITHKNSTHSLGAGLGFTTGYGLSYRYTPSKWGVQVNFAPFKNSSSEVYSVGLTFLYKLNEGEKITLYLYEGNHYYYNRSKTEVTNTTFPPTTTSVTTTESYINNGFGFGIEIPFFEQIGFNLMTGYAAYDNLNAYNLTGEAALYFKF